MRWPEYGGVPGEERCQGPQKAGGEEEEGGGGERGGEGAADFSFFEILFRTGPAAGLEPGDSGRPAVDHTRPSALYQPHGH